MILIIATGEQICVYFRQQKEDWHSLSINGYFITGTRMISGCQQTTAIVQPAMLLLL